MSIGALRRGVAPESVLPAAAEAGRELTTVEATSLDVVAGTPRLIVRFTADDPREALAIAAHVVDGTGRAAEPVSWLVTERVKGRWHPVSR